MGFSFYFVILIRRSFLLEEKQQDHELASWKYLVMLKEVIRLLVVVTYFLQLEIVC